MNKTDYEQKNQSTSHGSSTIRVVIICATIIILVGMIVFLIKSCNPLKMTSDTITDILDRVDDNNAFGVLIGETLKEENQELLQFKKRDITLFFQIARWRDNRGKEHSKCSGTLDKIDIRPTLGQYTLADARGVFEITYYINMANQDKWKYEWNSKRQLFTVTAPEFAPPNVGANIPGAKTSVESQVSVDCITFNESTTKSMLNQAIPRLKKEAALRQLSLLREDARRSLKVFFSKFIPRITNSKNSDFNVNIIFQDEDKKYNKRAL